MENSDKPSRTRRVICLSISGILTLGTLICGIVFLTGITTLSEEEQLLRLNSHGREVENGPRTTWVRPGAEHEIRESFLLAETDYVILQSAKDGKRRVQKGPGRFFLDAYEDAHGDKKTAITLTSNEYMHVTNDLTGVVRNVHGPTSVFPESAYDSFGDKQEISLLADYEAMVAREANGSFTYHFGSRGSRQFILDHPVEIIEFHWSKNADMETNHEYATVKRIDTRIQQLPFWYDDIRSNDNMEFELEGIIFWQVVDVQQLVRNTADPTSDIWHRLRARLAGASTSKDFLGFLENASGIKDAVIADELENYSTFYSSRGVQLHSMELIEVELHSDALAKQITDQIAAEATTRLTKVQEAITENDVALTKQIAEHDRKIKLVSSETVLEIAKQEKELLKRRHEAELVVFEEGSRAKHALLAAENAARLKYNEQNSSHELKIAEIESQKLLEEQLGPLLDFQQENQRRQASHAGAMVGLHLGKSVDEYLSILNSSLPNLSERLTLYKLHRELESRNHTTSNLASGNAKLMLTPENVQLNLGSIQSNEL